MNWERISLNSIVVSCAVLMLVACEEGSTAKASAHVTCETNASGLPIRVGYYAVNDTNCAAALRSWTAGVVIDGGRLRDIDGDYPVKPVRSLGGGRYRLGKAFDTVRILSPDSFIADEGKEHERRFLWCAEDAPK